MLKLDRIDLAEVEEELEYLRKWGHLKPDEDDVLEAGRYRSLCAEIEKEMVEGLLSQRLTDFDVTILIKRFGGWAVTDYGIQSLYNYPYTIERSDALDVRRRWLSHLSEKAWVPKESISDFAMCVEFATTKDEG